MGRVRAGRRVPVLALGVTALVIGAGGGAYAASKAGGTITVCVSHSNSTLYKSKTCRRRDKKLKWSVRGPAGPTGQPGPRGLTGANGAGPSYWANESSPVVFTATDPADAQPIVTLPGLPAGSYIVSAKAVAGGDGTSPGNIQVGCTLTNGSAGDESNAQMALLSLSGEYQAETPLTLQFALTTTSPSTVTLACYGSSSASNTNLVAEFSQITAVKTTSNTQL
jgi:hypothetical protein